MLFADDKSNHLQFFQTTPGIHIFQAHHQVISIKALPLVCDVNQELDILCNDIQSTFYEATSSTFPELTFSSS